MGREYRCHIGARLLRRSLCSTLLLHLVLIAAALGTAGITAGAVLAPVVLTAGLGVIGFSAAGPVAGTFTPADELVIIVTPHGTIRLDSGRAASRYR